MSEHDHHARTGLVSSWPVHTGPVPPFPQGSYSSVTCGCPRHIAYHKGQATRMGLTATYYPDSERPT